MLEDEWLKWKFHLEPALLREIPQVPRLWDGMNLRKEKVDIGDCQLSCEQEGQGTPVVLLHDGPGSTHHHFHPCFSQAAPFARVLYYDQRGCGLSDYQPRKGYSLDQAVDDLDRTRRRARNRPGPSCSEKPRKIPERFRKPVLRPLP